MTSHAAYDDAGRLSVATDPRNDPTTYAHDGAGNVTSIKDAADNFTWYEYDVYGRLAEITDPLTRVTAFAYDAAGRHVRTTDAAGQQWLYGYDGRSLLTSATDPLGDATTYGYDAARRRTAMTDPRSHGTAYGYDAADRLTGVTDALGRTVSFTHDASGNVASVTDARQNTTSYVHDELGDVVSETDARGKTRTATFDLLGRLDVATDARGIGVNYDYDPAGNLTTVTPTTGGAVAYQHDALNRVTSMADPTGTTGYSYDAASNVSQVAGPQGAIGYTYDALDRRQTMTQPGGTVTYGYDAASQLVSERDWTSSTPSTFTYTATGLLDTVARPNGVGSRDEYDAAGRLSRITHSQGGGTLARYQYSLDPNGNRTQAAVTGSAVANHTETYAYDELDRLTAATYGPGESASWTYDENGNRITQTSGGQTTAYAYNAVDWLTATSGAFVSASDYDDNGNRTAVSYGPGGSGGSDAFGYDWGNHLTGATVGGVATADAYAGDDLRASRTQRATTTSYLWDRLSALPTMVSDTTTGYVHGPAGLLNEASGATPRFPLQDALGSPRLRTDAAGAVTATADWDAWGNPRTPATADAFGYAGEQRDPTTNLVYLRARDYSPATGRLVQRDTVQPNAPGTQGYNPYAYVAGNPTSRTDPSGHAFYAIAFFDISTFFATGGSGTAISSTELGLSVAGAGSPLLALAAVVAGIFLLIVLIFIAIDLYVDLRTRCEARGLAVSECIGAGVRSTGDLIADIGKAVYHLALAGAAAYVATCVASIGLQLLTGPQIFANCPKLPKRPDKGDKCQEFGDEFPDNITDPGGGAGGPGGGRPPGPPGNPPDVPFGDPQEPVHEGDGWRWQGDGKPGSDHGNWINDGTAEKWHPHNDWSKHGPHSDYEAPDGNTWRRYPDGRWERTGKSPRPKKAKQCP